MKKLVFLFSAIVLITSCNFISEQENLQTRADSLEAEVYKKDAQLSMLVTTIDNINSNLQTIKEKENIIATKSKSNELGSSTSESINQDIQMIYELLVKNKNEIQNLENKFKDSAKNNRELKSFIENLNNSLKEKSKEIALLQEELKQKEYIIDELNYEVIGLILEMDSLKDYARNISSQLESTIDEANITYYAIGTKRELKNKNIAVKNGFLSMGAKQVLKDEFDQSYFTQVDMRSFDELPLYASKAKILTSHPTDSYTITEGENKDLFLIINNSKEFWSISKYLVIEVN